ncbi:MAG: tRNA preQ1(34) S-adenosylmethionine ribosyltransferase-isomerase QueA [Victivallaceae bacterium]|nr:tRNA preQ1(34) S-adenosylmethionine ribosyltransferase-isomerase QueA [Victivallaceae bacterium]
MHLPVALFDYELPEELIAQYPPELRGTSRMLVLDRQTGECELRSFGDISEYLSPGDGIIFNNTRVMNARMYGMKNGQPDAAKIEILLMEPLDGDPRTWKCLLKPGRRVKADVRVKLLDRNGELNCNDDWFTVTGKNADGSFNIKFSAADVQTMQQQYGHVPLPPYIQRNDENSDLERYQTVFAKEPGAVAAPTAGLHFTDEILRQISDKGVKTGEVTLHVGPGTFKPVSVENALDHQMHSENFSFTPACAGMVNDIHVAGHRILAVGTTTVRVLESCATPNGHLEPRNGATDIFLYPPYRPRAVDMLLTNFHLPKSTLLMLVSTFADREKVFAAYDLAIKEQFRFYSYGDCMLLK